MIIHSVVARNVLKYEKLELKDLPENGLIAISGFNESGKSTIGETICFALFGRTFSINENELNKIIRWGESDCSVTIRFSIDNEKQDSSELFAITRMLDCDGNHSAKLFQVYNEEKPIARGVERVDDVLYEMTAIEFEEFIESFYLAQREITTPHPHSYALKTMAGIATMEYCDSGIHEDVQTTEEECDKLESRINQLQEELDELELDDEKLSSLTNQHDQLLQDKANTDEALANIQNALDTYLDAKPKLENHKSKASRASFGRFLFFLLSVAGLLLWWILVKAPEPQYTEMVTQWLQTNVPQMTETHYPYLLYTGGVATVLFVLMWVSVSSHRGQIQRLTTTGAELADKLTQLDESRGQAVEQQRTEFIESVAANEIPARYLSEGTQADLDYLTQTQEQQADDIAQLSSDIFSERERVKRGEEYQDKMAGLQEQIDENQQRNNIRALASELLMGATRHLSKRFNHIVRDHVGKTLPLFTEDRYEHLQIDEDLTVRVFSNEKHDFMELEEISSGTQRQIMLAVRLALSQELVSRKVHGRQFLILDEPFAFFDEERTEKSLKVLPNLSKDLTQIWVIAQSFSDDLTFEQNIRCERDTIEKVS